MTPPLSVSTLTAGFARHPLLRADGLSVSPGTVVVLTGRNGSGKSTLLRTIAGLQEPLSGEVLLGGVAAHTLSPIQRALRVSIVLTRRPELQGLDVRTLVGMGRYPHHDIQPAAGNDPGADDALTQCGLIGYGHREVHTLSDGEMQKAMIARALYQDTPLLLLDEPTAFLDREARVDMMHLLRHLASNRGKAILFSSHDLEIALDAADLQWDIREGEVVILPVRHRS